MKSCPASYSADLLALEGFSHRSRLQPRSVVNDDGIDDHDLDADDANSSDDGDGNS